MGNTQEDKKILVIMYLFDVGLLKTDSPTEGELIGAVKEWVKSKSRTYSHFDHHMEEIIRRIPDEIDNRSESTTIVSKKDNPVVNENDKKKEDMETEEPKKNYLDEFLAN